MAPRPYACVHMAAGDDDPWRLVTVPGVEILRVGYEWLTSTGVFTFTIEDLLSAAAAEENPHIVAPVIKFGHIDPRFGNDGDFAVGRIKNLRVENNDTLLVGDYVGMPLWLASVLPSAYPRRSIEAEWRAMSQKDQPTWDGFFLTAVALLGAYYPACASLADLEAFWTGEDPPFYSAETGEVVPMSVAVEAMTKEDDEVEGVVRAVKRAKRVLASNTQPVAPAPSVAATVEVSDLMRTWWDTVRAEEFGPWAWVVEIFLDPPELIVDDGDGNLFRQSYEFEGDEIEFGEKEKVKRQYVSARHVAATQRGTQNLVASFATYEDAVCATVPEDQIPEEGDVQIDPAILSSLGLAADASEADINAALAARLGAEPGEGEGEEQESETPPATPPPDPAPETPAPTASVPDGYQLVDAAAWAEMQRTHQAMQEQVRAQATQDRDQFLRTAVREGRFPPASLTTYQAMWDGDPKGTKEFVLKLAAGTVPVEARAVDEIEDDGDPAVPSWMYPAASAVTPDPERPVPAHVHQNGGVTIISA
jgi:hypothetical protein